MQTFEHPNYNRFHTVNEYLAEASRLRALYDSADLVEVDDCGNIETVGDQARLAFKHLVDSCSRAAWNPTPCTVLRAAGLL